MRLQAESDEDIAKSFVLSESSDAGEDIYGKSADELARISGLIRGRQPYEFDPKELKQHLKGYREFKKNNPGVLFLDLIKWIGPPILVLALVYALIYLKEN